MANQYYQFTLGFNPPSITTQFQQSGSSTWQNYVEPNYSSNSNRSGGPGGPGQGNYLVVSQNDNVFINLVGPSGWTWPPDTLLQVIISPANSPNSGQGFTPFTFLFNSLSGSMLADNVTMQFPLPSTIQATPGKGNWFRYEITIAFRACAPGSTTPVYFSDDPEMDVMGGN
jgi:hypothetical protein